LCGTGGLRLWGPKVQRGGGNEDQSLKSENLLLAVVSLGHA
jgi:hypothetical protein